MCRHIAYIGPPVPLRSVLLDPPHGLYRQAWAPRRQRHGTVNADGFGVGWYADGDPVPARYRRDVPIWADASLPDLARVTRSGAVLAAVRSATPGTALGEAAAAPFAADRWLFSHNGVLRDWPGAAVPIAAAHAGMARGDGAAADGPWTAAGASISTLLSLEAMVDSAFLWALVLQRLRGGAAMTLAMAQTIAAIESAGGTGRFNFLLTDGRTIAATACGDTLWYRRDGDGVTVASEPGDDQPGWTEVPDRHALTASAGGVSVAPLAADTANGTRADASGWPDRAATADTDSDTDTDSDSDTDTDQISGHVRFTTRHVSG